MARRNVELARRFNEAFNARDIEALIALCAPDVEFNSVFAAVGGAIYHGHDGLRSWHRDLQGAWGEEIGLEPEAYFDLCEQTLTFYVYHARGQQSGAGVGMPAAGVLRSRDGRIAYVKAYTDREEALRDLGVTEDELEPIEP
jgi:ketosteroid isomerase-like protein